MALFTTMAQYSEIALVLLYLTLCDWSRKLMPLSRPITCETKSNHDLVARVFRTLSSLFFFYFKYIQFLWFYSYDYVSLAIAKLNQKALYSTLMILARFHACFRLFFQISLAITGMNAVCPVFFKLISMMEQYHPRVALYWELTRY